jgi:hypothetical protein
MWSPVLVLSLLGLLELNAAYVFLADPSDSPDDPAALHAWSLLRSLLKQMPSCRGMHDQLAPQAPFGCALQISFNLIEHVHAGIQYFAWLTRWVF